MVPHFGNMINIRLQLNSCSQRKTGWEIPVILICVPSLSQASVAGDPGRAAEASGPPSSVRWMARARCWGLSCVWRSRCLVHWTHWGWLQPLKGSSSFSSIKLYFFLSEIWLGIYIHKHIYHHLYYTVFYYTRNPAAPTYAFPVNFIWLKNTHKRVKGALGARNDCVPWVTHGRKPAVRGQQHKREG